MRETIYLQAGATANFIGAHFFSTQFAYYPENADDDAPVDLDVVFRNAQTQNPTPRAVVIDFKDNFRGIPIVEEAEDGLEDDPSWTGRVEKYTTRPREHAAASGEINSWSDLPLDYDPQRSLVLVTNNGHPDWDTLSVEGAGWGDWSAGRERYSSVQESSEERVRLLAEECDLMQGIQSTFDVPSFGSFGVSSLQAIKDDYGKTAVLAFPILSSASYSPDLNKVEDLPSCRKIVNDALVIAALEGDDDSLANLIVPIQNPSTWTTTTKWLHGVTVDPHKLNETTALLSAHIENVTLPTRIARHSSSVDLHSLIGHLNWRGHTRIAHLASACAVPVWTNVSAVPQLLYDFTRVASTTGTTAEPYAARYTSRGLDNTSASALDTWFEKNSRLSNPLLQTVHSFAYPLHHAFPALFPNAPNATEMNMLSSLSTSGSPAALLSAHARFVERVVALRMDVSGTLGLGEDVDLDLLRETAERLWTLRDGYADEESFE